MSVTIRPVGSLFSFIASDSKGNTVCSSTGSVMPTGATGGFLYVPQMSGAPNSTGATGYTGTVAMCFDSQNNMPWFLNPNNTFGGSTGASMSWVAGNGQVLIGKKILVSAEATVTFSNIPQVFNHLKLIVTARSDGVFTNGDLNLRFNGDSGGNYNGEVAYSQNTADAQAGFTAQTSTAQLGVIFGSSAPANYPAENSFDMLNYTNTTFYKTVNARSSGSSSTASQCISRYSAYAWANTSPITSITILPNIGNLIAGSIFMLYGIW